MPLIRKPKTGAAHLRVFGAGLGLLLLAGCLGRNEPATRSQLDGAGLAASGGSFDAKSTQSSQVIAQLQARKSVLAAKGPYAQVASAVLTASSGSAAAELRIARLKAEARAKNWLPQIGPQVSLSSLGALAAGLLVDQALFDNGRRKAERAYAAADVEVAAVGLSTEINQQIFLGLSYYVEAERARAQAAVSAKAADHLAKFQTIIATRVEGGISDRSEQSVIAQSAAEMQATLAADHETETSAMAQLAALADGHLAEVRGMDSLALAADKSEPLSVLKARSEGARSIAEAKIQKAGMLPGIGAVAGLGDSGLTGGLELNSAGIGPGMGANIKALNATADVVDRRIADAAQEANRSAVALDRQIATLKSRQAQGAEVLRQTEGNLSLFTEQYKAGRRSLLELVGQYDAYARLERDQVSISYDVALLELQSARDRGVLVDGANL